MEEPSRGGGREESPREDPDVEIDPGIDTRLARLIREGELFRALVQSATEFAIFALDKKGRVVTWNSGAERLLGYREEEIMGKHGAIIFTSEDRVNQVPEMEIGSALAGKAAEDERWHLRKDGRRFFASGFMMPLKDQDGTITGTVKILRDLTERREGETERLHLLEKARAAQSQAEAAQAAAEQANRVKDRFLASLSHELRTPLTPALMLLSQLTEDESLPEEVREDLAVIYKNVQMEARLIDDLLDVHRIASGKLSLHFEKCDAHKIIEHAARSCREAFSNKKVELQVRLGAANHWLLADPTRFEQVFLNLITNAFKFTPEGGVITVESDNDPARCLTVRVRDTGLGIEADRLSKMFTPFEQGGSEITRQFGGLGLGLVICRAIVDLHHGTVAAASEGKGKGATFTVSIPLSGPESGERKPES